MLNGQETCGWCANILTRIIRKQTTLKSFLSNACASLFIYVSAGGQKHCPPGFRGLLGLSRVCKSNGVGKAYVDLVSQNEIPSP